MFLLFFKINYLFIFGYAGSPLLCGLFSSCSQQGLHFSLSTLVSHYSVFSCCTAWALGVQTLVVTPRGFNSCGLQALEHRPNSCATHS